MDIIIAGWPEEAGGLGDEGHPDEGDEAGKKVAAAEDLAKEDGANPCGYDGDEEAEDGGFSKGEIVHGICELSVSPLSNSPNPG